MKTKKSYKHMDLEELIRSSQAKDYRALEELIRREQKNVFATFSYLNKQRENVSDMTQEALFRMAKGLANLKNVKAFKSWLNHIITNVFYDELRKRNKKKNTVSIDENSTVSNEIPDKKHRPLENIMSLELDNLIKNAILNLPDHFRIVIVLRELQGLSYEEIANVIDTNVGTVKSRIARARGKLQDGLKHYV